ncbi:Rho termination factor N-terminal domain-containing protein [Paenibacillus alvei]|uniref:Rho termination factor N-terminal domain-containing protein n=1 Tax=Paenibacillus alvei TaxID=44250 RepID=UPI000289C06B|nr:Rho termination factor N-terminal domain-containing protein [Paenibacillus alvei]EJW14728.1 hypothetical protein PAV_11c00690 [Paenibacillus alvei DSM 29]MCY9540925.1 Rho termination factor N-terminal domain-containing protein [Paenibacillus alvei]MCY9708171.1 Rho termination factor N-terminal domain-containing protein [Paenibacillus alvei]MEC0080196.1 Rho termination factor N-terminal domain-containing protein [Paenibacillus alvei]NEZ43315.1 hypothetical protein [Paenibacillus alvei]
MKCPNCGTDYSDSVLRLHLERCDKVEEETPIEEMGLPALREYAAKNSIELNGATKKADVLAAILGAHDDGK